VWSSKPASWRARTKASSFYLMALRMDAADDQPARDEIVSEIQASIDDYRGAR
jgi:hypothetical protein